MNSPFPILRRKAIVVSGLALFMLGSHYCLVGALLPGGMDAMACMAPVTAKTEAAGAHAAMPACHRGAAQEEGGEDTAPATTSPCCVALTPVVAPQIDKFAPDGGLLLLPAFDAQEAFRAPALASLLLRAPPEPPPLHAPPRAHASPRAPPLS